MLAPVRARVGRAGELNKPATASLHYGRRGASIDEVGGCAMNAIIFALIGAAFLFAASPAKTQTITTEETVTRTVTVTVPATPEGASQCRIIGRVRWT